MVKDRIEFAVADSYGDLQKMINDWFSERQNISVKKIEFIPGIGPNINKPMCMIWYEPTT